MKFKKQICAFLSFFFLFSQLGLAFNVHFCDNKVASVSINSVLNNYQTEKSCCGEVEKDSKCCHNKLIKTTEKQDAFITKSLSFSQEFTLFFLEWKPLIFLEKQNLNKIITLNYFCNANAPPLYQLNCQFIFYY